MTTCSKEDEPELRNELIRIKRALEESEAKFHSLYTNNHIVMLLIDPETGYIEDANHAACSYYGWSREELTVKSITNINLLEPDQVFKEMERARKEDRKYFVFRHLLSNGEIRDVEVYSGPIKIGGRNLLYSIIHDITVRRQAEEKLTLAYFELDQIFNAAGEGMRVIDKNFNVLRINDRLLKILDKTREETVGRKCYEIFPGPYCEKPKCPLKLILQGEQYVEYEVDKSVGKLENTKPFMVTAAPFQCGGQLIGMVQSFKDISERKRAEEILRESENRYRSLFELSPDAIIVYSEGKLVFANSMAAHLFGEKSPDNLVGKKVYELVHPDFRNIARLRIGQALSEGKTETTFHYKLIKKDGTIFDGEAASNSFVYQGKPAVQTIIRDTTRQKRELETAAKIQKQRLSTRFPLPEKGQMEIIYLPAESISGDSFDFQKHDEHTVVGFLGDVAGKGISAALSTSALKVLFYEICNNTKDPLEILKILNIEIEKYLKDEYVAACCFSFDFLKNRFTIVGAGINVFSFCHNGFYCCQEIIKGPFLGMFKNVSFDEKVINFKRGDKFYLYTDGLLDFINEEMALRIFNDRFTIREQKELLENSLLLESSLKDDTTWLAIEIK